MLKAEFDTEIFPSGNTQPVMGYQGEASFQFAVSPIYIRALENLRI